MSVRVLHAITRLTLGGSSENTITSCVALSRAGYDCTLATSFRESEIPSLEDARRRGCRVVDIPSLGRELAPLDDLAALCQLRRLIKHERPSIVHTHTSKAGFIGRLAARIRRVRPTGDAAVSENVHCTRATLRARPWMTICTVRRGPSLPAR